MTGLVICGTMNSLFKIGIVLSLSSVIITLLMYFLNTDCGNYCSFKKYCYKKGGAVFGIVGNIVSCSYVSGNGSYPEDRRVYSDNMVEYAVKEFKCECDGG